MMSNGNTNHSSERETDSKVVFKDKLVDRLQWSFTRYGEIRSLLSKLGDLATLLKDQKVIEVKRFPRNI